MPPPSDGQGPLSRFRPGGRAACQRAGLLAFCRTIARGIYRGVTEYNMASQEVKNITAESSGSVLVIGYDSWVTRLRVSGGFSLPAFMRMQLMDLEEE